MSEKVKVPKWFDDWYTNLNVGNHCTSVQEFAIYKLSRQGWGYQFFYSISETGDEDSLLIDNSKAAFYVLNHKLELISAVINGYEIDE